MKAMAPKQPDGESARWMRFLSRWALATVLMGLGLVTVNIGGVGFSPADNALGAEYSELLQAVRAPTAYRLSMVFDASSWIMMGGVLLALAVLLSRHAPIRALLIAGCASGLLTGVVGGALRMFAISDLAAHYAASTPAQQAVLLPAQLVLYEVVGTLFVAGDMFVGAAYLMVASVAVGPAIFPRWLTGWFVLAGALSLLQGVTSAVGAFSLPILLVTVIVGVLGLHAAIAAAFWRSSPALAGAVASAQA